MLQAYIYHQLVKLTLCRFSLLLLNSYFFCAFLDSSLIFLLHGVIDNTYCGVGRAYCKGQLTSYRNPRLKRGKTKLTWNTSEFTIFPRSNLRILWRPMLQGR
ncbi:hypothetical protein V6Z11_A11G320200 [Gossypium hirsutum]